jgi:hypothetical protein
MDIKSQLYSYYLDILNELSSFSLSANEYDSMDNLDYQNLNISDILMNIKESTKKLINSKVSEIINLNKNTENYYQLENYVKKLEFDLKYYLRLIYEQKIQIDVLEEKIRIYRMMQEDYEELKEKVKYEGGRFLNNERKDNEIIIIRQENTILKKELAKNEKINKLNDILKKDYLSKINNLQNENIRLKKKINELQETNMVKINKNENNEKNSNNNANNNKLNKTGINNNENTLSKWFSNHDIESVNSIIPNNIRNKNNLLKNLKQLFPKNTISNNKRSTNYNIIKNLYMNSNNNAKNNINSSTISSMSTNNIFTANYNKIINNINYKNVRHSLKKKYGFGLKNQQKNNSISMKIDKEEDKSTSINKYIKSNNDKFMYKSDRKKINTNQFNKIMSFKPMINYPLSCKHKTSSKLTKFKNKKIGLTNNYNEFKTKKNHSALNIRINSK